MESLILLEKSANLTIPGHIATSSFTQGRNPHKLYFITLAGTDVIGVHDARLHLLDLEHSHLES